MKSDKLTVPLSFLGINTLEEQIDYVYDYFKKNILAEDKRQRYKEKRIILKLTKDYMDAKEHCFDHLTGLDETEDKFEIDPCINSVEEELCITRCSLENIPGRQRVFCIYRARTLPWLNEVIKLANSDDEHIKIWETEVQRGRKTDRSLKIRFVHDTADYIMIFRNLPSGDFQLITAYPMVKKGDRKKADREYEKYKNCKK